jgi:hypothetical protein
MKNIQVDYRGGELSYLGASLLAKGVARENRMRAPTILAWRRQGSRDMSPACYDGADPETWWEKFGTGNGGELEISVRGEYRFILVDALGFETLDDIPLRNLIDAEGNPYLCLTALLGRTARVPTPEACMPLDGWLADQF